MSESHPATVFDAGLDPPKRITPTRADIARVRAVRAGHKIEAYFPDSGPYRRALYPKHIAFMEAGAEHRERLFLAGNQVGKTEMGSYEMTCHLTGRYPDWWHGRKFANPIKAWAAGDTAKTVRGILQEKMLGPSGRRGTGMLPLEAIKHVSRRPGVADALDQVWVNHISGGVSYLEFKSYDQRREAFQGTTMDVIWLDEEPPEAIYTECLIRTMTTGGLVFMTFTPLMGLTPLILSFIQGAELES